MINFDCALLSPMTHTLTSCLVKGWPWKPTPVTGKPTGFQTCQFVTRTWVNLSACVGDTRGIIIIITIIIIII